MSETNLGTLAPASSSATAASVVGLSIGDYLIRRLQDYGIHDVFGIPGDYILSFYNMLDSSPINVVGCTREDSPALPPMPTHGSAEWGRFV